MADKVSGRVVRHGDRKINQEREEEEEGNGDF